MSLHNPELKGAAYWVPISLGFFALTGLVFAAQAFPVPGIYLMFMGAATWSVLLVNLGFIGVGIEASIGAVPRGWIVLPAAWFLGYLAWAGFDTLALWKLRSQLDEVQRLDKPFDASSQSLVLGYGGMTFEQDLDGHSLWLLTRFRLPVVYVRTTRLDTASHEAVRLTTPATCDRLRSELKSKWLGIALQSNRTAPDAACAVSIPEDPTGPTVKVEGEREVASVEASGMPVVKTLAVIEGPDGSRAEVAGGGAWLLGWFPKPAIGCALDSGSPAWRCFARFLRGDRTSLRAPSSRFPTTGFAVGYSLGLEPVGDSGPLLTNYDELKDLVDKATSRAVELQTAELDMVIADPSTGRSRRTGLPRIIAERMDIILPRLDSMVAAMERAFEPGPKADRQAAERAVSNAIAMSEAIQNVPLELLDPYRARIKALTAKDNRIDMPKPKPGQAR